MAIVQILSKKYLRPSRILNLQTHELERTFNQTCPDKI